MDIEQGIITYLMALNVAGKRVYPAPLPQNSVLPGVTMQRISSVTDYVQSGASGLELGRFQFTSWAESYAAAKATAQQVKAALSGYKGVMGTVDVGASFLANEIDQKDPDSHLCAVIVDARIWSNA